MVRFSWEWIGLIAALVGAALAVGAALSFRKLRKAQLVTAEKQALLETVTIATQKVAEEARIPANAEVGPSELPAIEESLLRALSSGECALFAGSGVSAQAGLPVWQQTLAAVIERFEGLDPDLSWAPVRQVLAQGRPEVAADLISARVPRQELLDLFMNLYRKGSTFALPSLLEILGDIPFARILTANWDGLIEQAFRHRNGHVLSPDLSDKFAAVYRENAFMVLKLYGDLDRPESVSCSAEEFRQTVQDNPDFFKFVSSIYSTNTILFLGTSLAGIEDFVSALRLRGDPRRVHFALVPWQSDFAAQEERFRNRYGIRLLPFRPSKGFPEVVQWARNLRELDRRRPAAPRTASIRHQTITRLQFENIGSFRTFDQVLNPGWNLLLGNNGLGKSTILRAVAMALCGGDTKAEKAASTLLRAGERMGAIRLWLGEDRYELRLKRSGQEVTVECDRYTPLQTGTLVVLGFPPLRGISVRNPQGAKQVESPNPVIEDILPLLLGTVDSRVDNLKQWLVNVQSRIDSSNTSQQERSRALQMRDTFFRIMDELSPGLDVSFDHVDTRTWQVMVLTHDGTVSIDQLSQGMTSLLGWVGALLERMYEIHSSSSRPEFEPALLLVDEIAAHMHPEWEYAMVPLIRANFPKLQVIASTHSPLVVANTRVGEVFHLHRAGNEVKIEKLAMSFEGLRADQVLTGPAFRLATTLDPETKRLRDEYTVLLGKNRGEADERRFQQLARQLALRIPKSHEREEGREAIALLEQWMTERIKSKPPEQREKLVNEAELYFSQLDTSQSSEIQEDPLSNALDNYEQALKGFRALRDQRGEASTLKSLADFQRENGKSDLALETYHQALALVRELGDPVGEGYTLNGIGDIAQSRGERQESLQNYERALQLFQKAGDTVGEAWANSRIGEVHRSQGDLNAALEFFSKAVNLFRARNNRTGLGSSLKALGDLFSKQGDPDSALEKYEEAINLARAATDLRLEAACLQSMGDLQFHTGNLESAREHYEAALTRAQSSGDRRREAWARKALGDVQKRNAGKIEEAPGR